MNLAFAANRFLENFGIQVVRKATLDRLQLPASHGEVTPAPVPVEAQPAPIVLAPSPVDPPIDETIPSEWEDPIAVLRRKWGEVPAGDRRQFSEGLLKLDDADLLAEWERARNHDTLGPEFGNRGWYHEAYRSFMPGKRVLDIGCGMALSTLSFAEMGAHLTFVDIVPQNVELVRRLCRIKGISAEFLAIDRFEDLDQLPTFDVVAAIGSLINAPLAVTRAEISRLKMHLRPGGRWLHFAYPKTRWVQEGRMPFSQWGEKTDGPGTPWMEYHDRERVFWLFSPSRIRIIFECEWYNHCFNWFDIEILEH